MKLIYKLGHLKFKKKKNESFKELKPTTSPTTAIREEAAIEEERTVVGSGDEVERWVVERKQGDGACINALKLVITIALFSRANIPVKRID